MEIVNVNSLESKAKSRSTCLLRRTLPTCLYYWPLKKSRSSSSPNNEGSRSHGFHVHFQESRYSETSCGLRSAESHSYSKSDQDCTSPERLVDRIASWRNLLGGRLCCCSDHRPCVFLFLWQFSAKTLAPEVLNVDLRNVEQSSPPRRARSRRGS